MRSEAIGVAKTITVVLVAFVGSSTEVAVIVTDCAVAGAVHVLPAQVPAELPHITVPCAPPVTEAVKVRLPDTPTEGFAGAISEMLIAWSATKASVSATIAPVVEPAHARVFANNGEDMSIGERRRRSNDAIARTRRQDQEIKTLVEIVLPLLNDGSRAWRAEKNNGDRTRLENMHTSNNPASEGGLARGRIGRIGGALAGILGGAPEGFLWGTLRWRGLRLARGGATLWRHQGGHV